ncbi:Thioredoxin family protein [Rubrivivax sp. A210]|uniref:thioredoxin family protein n=1 Tax=Rubrivivax sp. A210 TaxID=2772301 RepID=UPI0019181F19|nr:thioredoxin family protein [Rubrivivax sp. A210]CAD5372150.1 Thioredoxin family protein [Rubrivivax sp. A210]
MKRLACLAGIVAAVFGLAAAAPATAALPAAYQAIVVMPQGLPERAEFDLGPALQRARSENKRLYVYLGASDCPFCRRYEAFLDKNAAALRPHFAAQYIVVDLRSALSVQAPRLFFRAGKGLRAYGDFMREIGDERERQLVYPSVWLFDGQARPLMQMPAGTGTFETVEEQLEILNLVQ